LSRTKATESIGPARIFAEGYETLAYLRTAHILPARSELIVKIPSVLSLALIGNASGKTVEEGQKSRSEAFSIRRLGGSRWRLRRTRCAMGFECQLAAESRSGRAVADGKGGVAIVDSVARAGKSVRGNLRGNRSPWGRHTPASACRSTSPGRQWWTRYEESK
jgi:hypothetical protein